MSKRTRHNPQGLKQQSLRFDTAGGNIPKEALPHALLCKAADKPLLSSLNSNLIGYFSDYEKLVNQKCPKPSTDGSENKRTRRANPLYQSNDVSDLQDPPEEETDTQGLDLGKLESAGQTFVECLQLAVSGRTPLSWEAQSKALQLVCYADLHSTPDLALKVARILQVNNQRHPITRVVDASGGQQHIISATFKENVGAWDPMRGTLNLPAEPRSESRRDYQRFSSLLHLARLAVLQVKTGIPDAGAQLLWRYIVGLIQQDLCARLAVVAQYSRKEEEHSWAAKVLLEDCLLWRLLWDDADVWKEGDRSKVHLLQLLIELVMAARRLPEERGAMQHTTQPMSQAGSLPQVDQVMPDAGPTQLLLEYSLRMGDTQRSDADAASSGTWAVSPAEMCDLGRQLLHAMLELFGAMEAAGRYNGNPLLKTNDRLEIDKWLMKWLPDGLPELKGNDMRLHVLNALPVRDRARLLWLLIADTKTTAWACQVVQHPRFQHTHDYVRNIETALSSPKYHDAQPIEALVDIKDNYNWYVKHFCKFASRAEELHDGFLALVASFVAACAELYRTGMFDQDDCAKFKEAFSKLQQQMAADGPKDSCLDVTLALGRANLCMASIAG